MQGTPLINTHLHNAKEHLSVLAMMMVDKAMTTAGS
jgi:hypothetical protein